MAASTEKASSSQRVHHFAAWAFALAVIAWVIFLAAAFTAIGDPAPGPQFESLLARKRVLSIGLLILSVSGNVASVILGIRASSRRGYLGWIGLALAVALFLVLTAVAGSGFD